MDAPAFARTLQDAVERVNIDPTAFLPILLTLTAIALVVWNGQRDRVSTLITIPWVIHLVLWSLLPYTIQPFLSSGLETSIGPVSRLQLATLHTATMVVLVLAHLAVKRPLIQPLTSYFDRYAPPARSLFWPAAISLVALTVVEMRISKVDGASFAETVAFAVTADASQLAESGLLSSVLVLFVGFAFAIISMGKREGVTRGTLYLAWATLLVFSAFSISRGSRAGVLVPAAAGILAISTLRGRARRRASFAVVTLGFFTILIGAPVAAVMGVVRGGVSSVDIVAVQDAYNLLLGGSSLGAQVEVIATEVNRKFDATGPGVELLAMEPVGSAGLTPILSATLSPIPRILFPSKPVPTSRDGTYLGTPYRVAAKAYGDPELGQVMPVSASAIALWEFGWLGPLALVLANLVSLALLNSVLITKNVYIRALGVSLLGLPNCEFFIGIPSALVQNALRLSLYLLIMTLFYLAWSQFSQSMSRRRASFATVGTDAGKV